MSKTFVFEGKHVVIGKIDSVFRTNPYQDMGGYLAITVILSVSGHKFTEHFDCGSATRRDQSIVDSMATKADERVAQILSYIDAGEAPAE